VASLGIRLPGLCNRQAQRRFFLSVMSIFWV